jgi:hypothetical protein
LSQTSSNTHTEGVANFYTLYSHLSSYLAKIHSSSLGHFRDKKILDPSDKQGISEILLLSLVFKFFVSRREKISNPTEKDEIDFHAQHLFPTFLASAAGDHSH